MLEKYKKAFNTKKKFWCSPKASDFLLHDLIIAKLKFYAFSLPALNLIKEYLANKSQSIKVIDIYSFWNNIIFKVPKAPSWEQSNFIYH